MKRHLLFAVGQLGYGGSEKQMTLLAQQLQDDFDITVLCTSSSTEPYGAILKDSGIEVLSPPARSKAYRLAWLVSVLRRQDPDVIICYAIRNYNALLVGLLQRRPLICTERSLGVWKSRAYLAVDHILYARSALIVTNSEATRDFVVSHFPSSARITRVVHNGIKVCPASESDIRGAPKVVFSMVAGLRPWKGHLFLVGAVERLAGRRQDFRVVLVGDGPLRENVEKAISSKGLERFFVWTGWQRDPAPFIEEAHVNLNLSSHESLSNSVMEGMVLGRPSVVTNVGGNAELVRHEIEGRVVAYAAVGQLVEEMAFLMDHRDVAVKYGVAARERISQHFTVEVMVQKMRKLIDSVAPRGAEQPDSEAAR